MVRPLRVAAAQVGRIDRGTPRAAVISRLNALLDQAAERGVKLAVFPETTFSTFFPRYWIEDQAEIASYFEKEPVEGIACCETVKAFFDKAATLGVDVAIGYGEETPDGTRFNTASYVSDRKTVGKYRKVHLPGTFEPFSKDPSVTNQLEKYYFKPGDYGFKAFRAPSLKKACGGEKSPIVGQLICNDRRWAEGWRVYGLQGVEIMCIGYNTTAWAPQLWGIDPDSMTREEAYADAMFHHKLVCQTNAYTNSTFLITSARCGKDDGIYPLISGSMIVDPEGHIVAENKTEEDELVVADIDLDACQQGKTKTFAFAKHRRVEHYGLICERAGVVEPEEPEEA
ncbi:hypothetical protein RTG_01687 [Rhodotorula toruloides ATCC 204091]|uniref:Carbon-nitrogen hydrolase n=1 Tax=Rhodotorula toruloides TaxID=5286 RepID=A0A0K3CSS1_RHOTO|nr:hypothetical protein RTG_01687 [Rhodotorula toruloides ATCC 204091]KAK4333650.1 Carbon-nitrogen hydrolase [Rhodotorula toruloides]PRQ69854.1 Carbon-nitrogen hydrolase [Rhodotorula toruloides]